MICADCGYRNNHMVNYCAQCGNDLSADVEASKNKSFKRSGSKKHRNIHSKTKWNPGVIALCLFSVVIIIFALQLYQSITSNTQTVIVEKKSDEPKIELIVFEISSKFICSCGTCGELSLDVCTCEVAVDERQFIRMALQSGNDYVKIINAVNQKYGWMKKI